jgi:hypothetical protein
LSVLQLLLRVGELHFDVFALVRECLKSDVKKAVASSCRLASQLCRAAVSAVELSTSHQPLRCELADKFPAAVMLHVDLCEDAEGEPCGSAAAALRLEHWASITPRLLVRLKSLQVDINTSNFDNDLNAELVDFVTK